MIRTGLQPHLPIEIGAVVTIFALDDRGPSIEGIATVQARATERDYYWVKFAGDPRAWLRFVSPDWQSDPDRVLQLLDTFWHSHGSNDAIIEDFFPDYGTY